MQLPKIPIWPWRPRGHPPYSNVWHGIALVFVATLMISSRAQAEAIVLKSSLKSMPAGATVISGKSVKLPKGASIVLLRPDGATQTYLGPGTLQYADPEAQRTPLISAFAVMFRVRADTVRLGGVRNSGFSQPQSCSSNDQMTWLAIAGDWNSGCRPLAMEKLEASLAACCTAVVNPPVGSVRLTTTAIPLHTTDRR